MSFIGLLTGLDLLARDFRVGMMPNGTRFNCTTCHFSPFGGGARNAFGNDVFAIVRGGAPVPFWNATLAAKDSDGDGFTNGQELGDPDGDGRPTAGAQITNPGSATSRPQNQAPTIQLTQPSSGATFVSPASITMAATANDADGTVAQVEFFVGSTSVFVSTQSPHQHVFSSSSLAPGKHNLSAKATDNAGASTTSATVEITIVEPAPVKIESLARAGNSLELAWTGGAGPFIVQTKPALSDSIWRGVQALSTRSARLTLSAESGFFRVTDLARPGAIAYAAAITGAAERPAPVTTSGSGSGLFWLEGDRLGFSIQYHGLSGPATGAHIHGPATEEESAGVLIDLEPFHQGAFGVSGSIAGSVALTAEQKAALIAGRSYVNIHTPANPPGEIRGQIIAVPTQSP